MKKTRKSIQVASRISGHLKKALDMWSHSQRISNSETIRIALERHVLPEAQKNIVVTLLHEIAGTQRLILKQLQSFGKMTHDIELVAELVGGTMMVSDYYSKKDEVGDLAARKYMQKRYDTLMKIVHARHKEGQLYKDFDKEKRKPL